MNDNFESKMSYEIKKRIAILNFEKEQINNKNQHTHFINKKYGRFAMKKRVIATICTSIVLVSGVVLGTNIENIKRFFGGGLGNAIQSAAENGYIANPQMDYIESNVTVSDDLGTVIDDMNTEVKINDFMMDDLNLNIEFNFKFDEKIKDIFNLDNLHNIELNDLIVRDEENRILYGGYDKQAFEKYCQENNLEYVFGETNENYLNCGLQCYPYSHDKNTNLARLTYNIYTDDTFPKSRKLYFSFGKIKLVEESSKKIVTIKGNWNIKLDVPENMYNRNSENYKLISCDNDDFEVYTSKVSDTGFEIGVMINNIKKPEYPSEVENARREIWKKYEGVEKQTEANDEFEELLKSRPSYLKSLSEYYYQEFPIALNKYEMAFTYDEINKKINYIEFTPSYVENSEGKQFICTFSPGRRAKGEFLDGDKYNFYETFSMTKAEATDKVKVVLYYYEKPVTIELEKVK